MNLRMPPTPVLYADHRQQAEHERQVERARARQLSRYAVAPRHTVGTIDGRLLGEGQPVTAADFVGGKVPGWRVLADHIARGRVLENDRVDEGPQAA